MMTVMQLVIVIYALVVIFFLVLKTAKNDKDENFQRSRLCGGEGRGWYDV